MQMTIGREVAEKLDNEDVLSSYRSQFFMPPGKTRSEQLYFTGNSLGLQPRAVKDYIQQELDDWQKLGVEGHFHSKNPWFGYHHFFDKEAKIVGAKPEEVVVMNNLTVNLHLLLASFYRPTNSRYKIIMEGGAFPSDMYVIESQVKHHGYDYQDAVIEIEPREGEHALRTEDIVAKIKEVGDECALVFFSGVQYYTGQAFDIKRLTEVAHSVGAFAGFDCAHAAGNIEMQLHDWEVDFAAWCTYKYLNSSPGGVSGIFVHEKHGNNPETPRFAGWWGHKESERFQMKKGYIPEPGAAGWQLSNAPVLAMAAHKASLDMFDEVGMPALAAKGKKLNSFMEEVVLDAQNVNEKLEFEIITPEERGCQLSMLTNKNGKALFDYLTLNDVIADWREPNVIRLAPVPMYNSFMDVWEFGDLLSKF
ncbi:MAG: kynureninase [Bacteroidetes bacterium]|nr:MAG: kynureninase [Bacteroidota bacterium]